MDKFFTIDIEANGLLYEATKIHCIVVQDVESGMFTVFDGDFKDFEEFYTNNNNKLIAHNGIGFDFPLIKRLTGLELPWKRMYDTLVISRMIQPDRVSGHSLKSYGEEFGFPKGDFEEFETYTPEMLEYCKRDVEITTKIWKKFTPYLKKFEKAIDIDREFAYNISLQEENGFTLDVEYATHLCSLLGKERDSLTSELISSVPKVLKKCAVYNAAKKSGRLLAEDPLSFSYITEKTQSIKKKDFKYEEFNPNSRQQIVDLLQSKYDWEPVLFTEKGAPIVDGKVLERLPYEEANTLARIQRLTKQLSMIRDGKLSWMSFLRGNRVHGGVMVNGATGGRCTHCVPMDTQALTRDGWKHYDELSVGDEVLGYDMKSNTKKWTKILNLHKFKDAQVGEMGNNSFKVRCTDEHKWVSVYRDPRKNTFKYELISAKDFPKTRGILTNAPYENNNAGGNYVTPLAKYDYNHSADITRMNPNELNSFMTGFLLADGYLKKSTNGDTQSWSFTQAEGELLEAARIGMYLNSSTRVSTTCKTKLKGVNQRWGYNVTQTQVAHVRSKEGMVWKPTTIEDVWCPTTELGTWVMKQGRVITITGNSKPNMAQVDRKDLRMRKCWIPKEGWGLVGCDASGLELRILAHYLSFWDDGAYAQVVLQGDVHTYNQKAMGLNERDTAKTAIYGLIYGAGNEKLGNIVMKDLGQVTNSSQKQMYLGGQVRSAIQNELTGYKELMDTLAETIKRRSYLTGIDGRPLFPRNDYSALNLLIQSAGASVMKKALNNFMRKTKFLKLKHGVDFGLCANVHDEVQIEAPKKNLDKLGKMFQDSIIAVTHQFDLKCSMDGEYKEGTSWAETH